jgi:Holliday junction resolvase RusA-like endonuclease
VITFTVHGQPVGKERARVVNGHAYTPRKTASYEAGIRLLGQLVAAEQPDEANDIRSCDWKRLSIDIFFSADARRPDCDNVVKSIMDGLQGVFWATDNRVIPAVRSVCIGSKTPRVVVTITPAEVRAEA